MRLGRRLQLSFRLSLTFDEYFLMDAIKYKVLWSRDLTRKNKRWSDGTVIVQSSERNARLVCDSGNILSRSRLFSAIEEGEETDAFESFIVQGVGQESEAPGIENAIIPSINYQQLQGHQGATRQQHVVRPPSNLSRMSRPFSIPNQKKHPDHPETSSEAQYKDPRPMQAPLPPPRAPPPVPVAPPPAAPPAAPPAPPRLRSRKEILRMIGMDCDSDSSSEAEEGGVRMDSNSDPDRDKPCCDPEPHQAWGSSSMIVGHEEIMKSEGYQRHNMDVDEWGGVRLNRQIEQQPDQEVFGADLSNHPRSRPEPCVPLHSTKPFKAPSLTLRPTTTTNLHPASSAPAPTYKDSRSYIDLSLPASSLVPNAKALPKRRVVIPTSFNSIPEYLQSLMNALREEVELVLLESCAPFHHLLAHVHNRQLQQHQQQVAAKSQQLLSGGFRIPFSGPLVQSIAQEIQASCISQRVPYFSQCELKVWRQQAGGGGSGDSKTRGQGRKRRAEDEVEEEGPASRSQSISLVINEVRSRVKGARVGDLWLISSHPYLMKQGPGSWVGLVRSRWHGPNQDGKFEVDFVTPPPSTLPRAQAVYCLKGPDALLEIRTLDLLQECIMRKGGFQTLLHYLISNPPNPSLTLAPEAPQPSDSIVHRLVVDLRLNEDQAKVMFRVSSWVTAEISNGNTMMPPAQAPDPICLIHGPFGSGKSK